MLTIVIEGDELYDEETETFSTVNDVVVQLEHSLVSVSKWESKYHKPFLSNGLKTPQETFDYIQAMVVTPGFDPENLFKINKQNLREIQEYIESTQSATTFGEVPGRRTSTEVITSELIYFWMVAFQIPFECETWHLNRLFSLIRIANIKNSKPQKVSQAEISRRNAELNAKRKAELGTSG